MTPARGLAAAFVAATIALTIASPGRDVRPFIDALDAVRLPATWRAVATDVRPDAAVVGCFLQACPEVTRSFTAGRGDVLAVWLEARLALAAQGYADDHRSGGTCRPTPSSSTCFFSVARDHVRVEAVIAAPGHPVEGVSRADVVTVLLRASRG